MEKLTDAQIFAADAILEMCNINGTRRTTEMAISLDTIIGSRRIYFRHH